MFRRLWESFRSWVYDTLIVAMTAIWYREVMVKLPPGSYVLDVGIGTATSLIRNRDLLLTKNLRFHGVDYDAGYIEKANAAIKQYQLTDHITTTCASIHDYSGGPFDVVYFSGSFMIIPDKEKALRACCNMLKDRKNGKVYFTQTFERPGIVGAVMGIVKPFFKYLLTIDFGEVTYEKDFRRVVESAGCKVDHIHVITDGRFRKHVLVSVKP